MIWSLVTKQKAFFRHDLVRFAPRPHTGPRRRRGAKMENLEDERRVQRGQRKRQQGKGSGGLVELTFDQAQRDAAWLEARNEPDKDTRGTDELAGMLANLGVQNGNTASGPSGTRPRRRASPSRSRPRQPRGQRSDAARGPDESSQTQILHKSPPRQPRQWAPELATTSAKATAHGTHKERRDGIRAPFASGRAASESDWRSRAHFNTPVNHNRFDRSTATPDGVRQGPITPRSQAAAETRMQEKRRRQADSEHRNVVHDLAEGLHAIAALEAKLQQEEASHVKWAQGETSSETPSRVEGLGRQVRSLWQSTRLTPEQHRDRDTLSSLVERALERRWPRCNLHVRPFGSSLTGLVEAKSDVDLCLIDPTRPRGVGTPARDVLPLPEGARVMLLENPAVGGMPNLPDYYNVRSIARALEKVNVPPAQAPGRSHNVCAFSEVQPISGANVPIVKFKHKSSGLSSDLNVNDTFGIRNSELIRAYCNIAPDVVFPMIYTVKRWASRRTINDPTGVLKEGVSLNSYTICLIVIQFLQVCGVVPNLQAPALIKALRVPQDIVWQKPARMRTRRRRPLLDDIRPAQLAVQTEAAGTPQDVQQPSEEAASAMENAVDMKIWTDPVTQARAYNTTFADVEQMKAEKLAEELSQGTSGPVFSHAASTISTAQRTMETDVRLGTLLTSFFEWLADFDFSTTGISIRHGQPFRRHELDDSPYPFMPPENDKWEEQPMVCQDPFIVDRNTCGSVIDRVHDRIMQESRRAVEVVHGQSVTDATASPGVPLLSTLFGRAELEREMRAHENLLGHVKFHDREEMLRDAEALARARRHKS